jgi:hypothetical protein
MVLVSGPSVSHLHSPFTSPCRTFSPCLRTRRTTRPQRCLRPQPRPPDGPRTAPCVDPVLKERPTASSSRRRVTAVGGASARSRCWVQRIQIRAFTPQRGLRAVHRSNSTWVYVAVCNIQGASPLQWLEQWGWETERPPDRYPVSHFYAPRLIALRGGDRNEETPATENEREVAMRRACARTPSPRSFFAALDNACSQHPARSADWPRGP